MRRQRSRKIDDEDRVVQDEEKSRDRTMNRAVKLLAAKPRSVGELRERLFEKLWTNEAIVEEVIEKLKEYKYLDDAQFALDTALSKLRQKPQGPRRLQQAMSQKKLEQDVIANAVESAFERLPEDELIDAAIEKRLRVKGAPQSREDTKKFFDHMMRLGFDYSLIRKKIDILSKQK